MTTPTGTSPQGTGHRLTLTVDGRAHEVEVDVRSTLLDTLRERLGVTTVKKGCDHGQCGSCTVLLDGRRHLTCLSLAVQHDGAALTTADGLAATEGGGEGDLHRVQQAFLDRDAYQCGYCTPGQVCSAVGALAELEQGHPSHVTDDLEAEVDLDDDHLDDELRERMSGNLCRCGAYVNILAAIKDAAGVATDGPTTTEEAAR
ncbi:2Fe-2S iron-sulfur cluster-binding protein [Nocardioides aurantiacus]|uniref:Xanthine dehydrogenase YagT iron-sulfur-binding subunit n=1 Tax=Nocardioides aurantiacus TaxID=86796 RepID=A0A3N2CRS7_9ACTN|nr:2Fe-2S iron-sulfur cluster-binding protein [Nocardioides aurantiacus]ROR90229.1 xanthine dehydrogenase YagT iron-sulfur-binding subunit [Nocardioides aurantiacus]